MRQPCGLTLLLEIKARQPELPSIMVTAYSDDERRDWAAVIRSEGSVAVDNRADVGFWVRL
jgi:hypothetical protein